MENRNQGPDPAGGQGSFEATKTRLFGTSVPSEFARKSAAEIRQGLESYQTYWENCQRDQRISRQEVATVHGWAAEFNLAGLATQHGIPFTPPVLEGRWASQPGQQAGEMAGSGTGSNPRSQK